MAELIDVRDIEGLPYSIQTLQDCRVSADDACRQLESDLQALLEEAQNDLSISNGLLEMARAREAIAMAMLVKAEAELAMAGAEVAAAAANPIALAAALARLAEAETEFMRAKDEHDAAVAHRERMEHRVELCEQAVQKSQELLERTMDICRCQLSALSDRANNGSFVIDQEYSTLQIYLKETTPEIRTVYNSWLSGEVVGNYHKKNEGGNDNRKNLKNEDVKEEKEKPVRPDELRRRMNLNYNQMLSVLAASMAKDPNFANTIYRMREQAKDDTLREKTELAVKKNMVGRLAEEIVRGAFSPYGTIQEQVHRDVEDRFTKVDFVVSNLRVPIILGRGQGNGAPKGGSIAIEVKSGQSTYINQQKEHLIFQASGHQFCDASCVICSRDIHDMSQNSEQSLRENLHEAGSPILAMLPYKDDMDKVCLDFIFGRN